MVLGNDMPQPSIEADLIPHSLAENKATRNANLNHERFGVVGVEPVAGAIIHAEDGEINSNSDEDDGNDIIAINDAPLPQMAQDPLTLSDSSDDEPNDDNSDNGDDDDQTFDDR